MADGSTKAVEEVEVGDQVMGDDSTPRTVVSTHQGYAPLFKITPVKGESHTVSLGHIMCLKIPIKIKKRRYGVDTTKGNRIEEVSVQEYLEKSATYHRDSKLYRTGVEFPGQEVPLDPYFLGVWLGDGDQHRAAVTTEDEEIVAVAKEQALLHGLHLRPCKDYGYQGKARQYHLTSGQNGKHFNPIMAKLESLGILNNKRIPMVYRVNSREVRFQVLGGLIDTDGHANPATNHCEITQKRKDLAEDIVFLARSIGFAAYMHERTVVCQDYVGVAYRIGISGHLDQIPTRLQKKKFRPRRQIKDVLHTGFTVEAVGAGDYYGFEVDGNHRHLLGDFTVTHNSFLGGAMFKGTGARFVNTDTFFEHLLKKRGLPFDIDPANKIMYAKQMVARVRGKLMAKTRAAAWVNGMLPLVVDGTGKEFAKIKTQKKVLEDYGYDTAMVLVNTTLEVALQRNRERPRKVREDDLIAAWKQVQKNIKQFRSLFGGRFAIVDNSEAVSGPSLAELKVRMAKAGMKLLNASLRNVMGKNTIAELQRQGGKYISDIDPKFGKADALGV